jgi:hypothetical protein
MNAAERIDLNLADNMWGKLSGEVRARLVAAINDPGEETWDDAHGIILRFGEGLLTLWQAVMAVDPTFPRTGPVTRWVEDDSELGGHSEPVSGWERTPGAETIIQAINYATR